MEIVSFTINLEHIGDIIDKNLCEVATGAVELTTFHKRVCESLQAAFGIFSESRVSLVI